MSRWTDVRTEHVIGALLRIGVLASTALVLVGAVVTLVKHGGDPAAFQVFQGEPPALRGIAGIVREALVFSGPGIIQLGLLVQVATPVARVAFSIFAFAAERDRTYVVITAVVLAVLCFSLFSAGL